MVISEDREVCKTAQTLTNLQLSLIQLSSFSSLDFHLPGSSYSQKSRLVSVGLSLIDSFVHASVLRLLRQSSPLPRFHRFHNCHQHNDTVAVATMSVSLFSLSHTHTRTQTHFGSSPHFTGCFKFCKFSSVFSGRLLYIFFSFFIYFLLLREEHQSNPWSTFFSSLCLFIIFYQSQ